MADNSLSNKNLNTNTNSVHKNKDKIIEIFKNFKSGFLLYLNK